MLSVYFNWNKDTLRWYINAEKHTGFYKKLAKDLIPLMQEYKTLCDIGCGAALFDFAIAPYIESVDCVDINETALASVKDRAEQYGRNKYTHAACRRRYACRQLGCCFHELFR
jgi:2-polyprenyl-3-methyl-5-hydroxy-6-metoxy-1,4-benzoquinol methylase